MARVQNELKGRGRILVRYSGTESLARVMIEGENEDKIKQMAGEIADAIGQEIGA
jgi:phosphoglucosamine mutase